MHKAYGLDIVRLSSNRHFPVLHHPCYKYLTWRVEQIVLLIAAYYHFQHSVPRLGLQRLFRAFYPKEQISTSSKTDYICPIHCISNIERAILVFGRKMVAIPVTFIDFVVGINCTAPNAARCRCRKALCKELTAGPCSQARPETADGCAFSVTSPRYMETIPLNPQPGLHSCLSPETWGPEDFIQGLRLFV